MILPSYVNLSKSDQASGLQFLICEMEISIVSTSQGHCADALRQEVKAVVEVVEALRDLRESPIDNTVLLHETAAAVRSTDRTACSPRS